MDLLKKLKLKTGQTLWAINMPAEVAHLFDELEVKEKPGKTKPLGQLMIFATESKELIHHINRLADYIGQDTLLWLCYPKKTGSITSDLCIMKSWELVFALGFRGQTSVSIDNDWTGLRVTNAPRKKPSDADVPMEERKAEGIDYVARTVQLPADAQAAINKHKGMSDYFYGQSFTCKKEYLISITDAKKEETRLRRIDKMIEMLQEKMQAKKKK